MRQKLALPPYGFLTLVLYLLLLRATAVSSEHWGAPLPAFFSELSRSGFDTAADERMLQGEGNQGSLGPPLPLSSQVLNPNIALRRSYKETETSSNADTQPESRSTDAVSADGRGEDSSSQAGNTMHELFRKRSRMKRSRSDSCWARKEYPLLLSYTGGFHKHRGKRLYSSKALSRQLVHYGQMHKACVKAVQNWTALFLGVADSPEYSFQGSSSPCTFLVHAMASNGLGNRLQATVAVFGYALATNRVLLIGDLGLSELLCQPFPNSDWLLPWDTFGLMYADSGDERLNCTASEEQWDAKVPKEKKLIPLMRAELSYLWTEGDQNFFCDGLQRHLQQVTTLLLRTEQYFLPNLFLVPLFQNNLEKLFPDFQPFGQLAHVVLQPNNQLWERITREFLLHFEPASRTVGIQVRTFVDDDMYSNPLILDCLANISAIVAPPLVADKGKTASAPLSDTEFSAEGAGKPQQRSAQHTVNSSSTNYTLLFLTSLHQHHSDSLRSLYSSEVAYSDGTSVKVLSFPALGAENHEREQDKQALTEIWLLSLCNRLLTSHFSTFGYVASGLSRRPSYLMNLVKSGAWTFAEPLETNGRPVCELATSSEPCSHFPPHSRTCQAVGKDSNSDQLDGVGPLPAYLERCQDASFGLRMRDPHQVER
eukprot:TRINITY_DN8642_c0_g1_i1.p1 TRINITY_DN8642_c0_g1~~TRINITY_DN8642_c0_g1_i1.p1  ORF type:complete len:653 (+),score=62.87 TRINITY_DN8642_c0_g1_i1:230-2188(+)